MAPPIIPFFKLPAVARADAIQGWEVDQVIESTMLSDTFREQVEIYRYSCEKLTWVVAENAEINIINNYTKLCIRFKNMDDEEYTPVRKVNGIYHFFNKKPKTTNSMKQTLVRWYFHVDENNFECRMKMMDEVTKFLMKILKDASYKLSYEFHDPNLEVKDLFIWKYTKSFTRFNIEDYKKSGPNISPEDLVFLLEDIKAETRRIELNVVSFKYKKPIQAKNIRLNNMSWVTTECLKGPEVVQIVISGESIDYNEIIRHWLNGGSPNLENIHIDYFGFCTRAVQLFDGFNQKLTVFTESDFQHRVSFSLPERSYDIQRKGDGRLCTIFTEDGFMLQMLVWHPKHFSFLEPKTKERLKVEYGIRF